VRVEQSPIDADEWGRTFPRWREEDSQLESADPDGAAFESQWTRMGPTIREKTFARRYSKVHFGYSAANVLAYDRRSGQRFVI
jgi:hypothetical protein